MASFGLLPIRPLSYPLGPCSPLRASLDPAVPRLAVLVPPDLASLTQVLLGRALTPTAVGGLTVLTSPGLSLAPVTTLLSSQGDVPPGPPSARSP